MNLVKRLGVAVSVVVIGAGLAGAPSSASAAEMTSSVVLAGVQAPKGSACTAATNKVTKKKRSLAHAKKSVAAKRKAAKKAKKAVAAKQQALNKAKRSKQSAAAKRVKKAQTTLKKRKAALRKAKAGLKKRRAAMTRALEIRKKECALRSNQASVDQLGQLLGLLTGAAGGGAGLPFDLGQLTGLLDGLIPGGADALDPAQLTALLAGFNGATDLDLADLSALAGLLGNVSSDQLTALVGGSLDPAVFTAVFEGFIAQFAGLAGGGLPIPADLDPLVLLNLLGGLIPGLPDLCLPLPLPLCLP